MREKELPRQVETERICDHEATSGRNKKKDSVIEEIQGNNPQKQGLNRYHDDTKFKSFNSNSERDWA